jgi:transcriptional regulator with XRE-family HTH domain
MHSMTTRDESGSTPALARLIGQRVRAGRTELGWTLDQLAARSGVSRRMLVNVEQGATNPSIATLLHLSDALGIGLPALVDTAGDATAPAVVHRAGELSPMWTGPAGGSAVMVAGTTPPDVTELWDWRLGPGETYPSEAHRAGTRELILVLSGTVDLLVGDTDHRLKAGDSASFDGALAHSYRNASAARGARFTLAVFEPDPAGPSHPRSP